MNGNYPCGLAAHWHVEADHTAHCETSFVGFCPLAGEACPIKCWHDFGPDQDKTTRIYEGKVPIRARNNDLKAYYDWKMPDVGVAGRKVSKVR